jgi:hypothetical protein
MTEVDANAAGSTKALGASCANAFLNAPVSRIAAFSAATSGTVAGWNGAAATESSCLNDAGRWRRSFAFASANCAGVRVRLILSAMKALTTAACRAGKRPSRLEAERAYSALAFAWRTNQSWAPAEEAASARSSATRIATTASPKRVSVPNRALSGAKAAACSTDGALTGTGRVGGGT